MTIINFNVFSIFASLDGYVVISDIYADKITFDLFVGVNITHL